MKRLVTTLLGASAMLWASSALPCGGAFGPNVSVDASQTLVVAHKAGIETYVFRPHFCGESKQFGLILPVPAQLSKNPALGDPALFTELDKLSAPQVVKRQVCKGSREAEAMKGGDLAGGASNGAPQGDGINVIQKGQVGIFDWTLVKADTKAAFTDWLDANGLPHSTDADTQFAHYVTEGWYFVAFKVTAGDNAPPAGKKLCGDFGPIELAFPAASAVVPTRIAAVSTNSWQSPSWRIYGVSSANELSVGTGSSYPAMTSYSDTLAASALSTAPQLSKIAAPGDRLVRLEVGFAFNGLSNDLFLTPRAPQTFHSKVDQVEIIDCATTTPTPTPVTTTGDGEETPTPAATPTTTTTTTDGCNTARDGGRESGLASAIALALAVMLVRRRRSAL